MWRAQAAVTTPSGPEVRTSVIVIGYAPADLLERCLGVLRAQHADHPDAEVLVVAHPSHQGTSFAPVRERFPDVRWLDASPEHNVARMRGLGIARSRGDVVALLEGDCMPAPGWLRRVSELRPVAAVGGAIEPGTFVRGVDWAAYFCEFAQFMAPLPATVAQLPGTNVVYRRAALPAAERLEAEGMFETFLNATLGADALSSDSSLLVRHERRWRRGAAIATRFHHGRVFAALRVRGAPLARRVSFVPLALALPVVLAARVFREVIGRRRYVRQALRSAPWIAGLSIAWAAGELAGYVAGAGSSLDKWR